VIEEIKDGVCRKEQPGGVEGRVHAFAGGRIPCMDHVNGQHPEHDKIIQIADLRATVEQIVRAELLNETYAIVQVRIGEHVFTRSLRGEDVSEFRGRFAEFAPSRDAYLADILHERRLEDAHATLAAAQAALAEARFKAEQVPLE
jgi:hypothetical protein